MSIEKATGQALVPMEKKEDNFDLLVVFRLLGQEYGLMASSVREIIRNTKRTRVPNSSRYIDGVINLRGRIVPVFNMRRRLSLEEQNLRLSDECTIMVVESDGNDAGLVVDRVADVVKIDDASIDTTVSQIKGLVGNQFIAGTVTMDKRLITMLRLEPLLMDDKVASKKD